MFFVYVYNEQSRNSVTSSWNERKIFFHQILHYIFAYIWWFLYGFEQIRTITQWKKAFIVYIIL